MIVASTRVVNIRTMKTSGLTGNADLNMIRRDPIEAETRIVPMAMTGADKTNEVSAIGVQVVSMVATMRTDVQIVVMMT